MAALVLLLIDALVVFWLAGGIYRLLPRRGIAASLLIAGGVALALAATQGATRAADAAAEQSLGIEVAEDEIGRASCRERVCLLV